MTMEDHYYVQLVRAQGQNARLRKGLLHLYEAGLGLAALTGTMYEPDYLQWERSMDAARETLRANRSDRDFTATVEHGRRGRCDVAAYASDHVGAIAAEAARKLGLTPGSGDQCTLATRQGIRLHHTDRMGYPADLTFRLIVTGSAV